MKIWLAILFLCSAHPGSCFSAQARRAASAEMATLSVVVTDTFGALLNNPQISIRRLDKGKRLPIKTRGSAAQGIPFGTYEISASLSGYTDATRTVKVDRKVHWITLALALGEIEGPSGRDLNGRIVLPMNPPQQMWIKLVGVYSDVVEVARVDEKGFFLIENVLPGDYFIIVLQPGRVLKNQRYTRNFGDAADLEIDLTR